MHLLEGRGSCKEETRSATLNRVALTSLKLAAGAAAAVGCAELVQNCWLAAGLHDKMISKGVGGHRVDVGIRHPFG